MPDRLVRQATARTLRKVKAASFASIGGVVAGSIAVNWLSDRFPILITPDVVTYVQILVGGAVTGVATWAGGYFVRERATDHTSLVEAVDAAIADQAADGALE